MTKAQALKIVLTHFRRGDKYNQLRPGETTLAIECFIEGIHAMLKLADSIKLSQKDFENMFDDLDAHFAQFADSKTTKREIA